MSDLPSPENVPIAVRESYRVESHKGFFQMNQKRHAVDHIIARLRRTDLLLGKGVNVSELCKQLEMGERTDTAGGRMSVACSRSWPRNSRPCRKSTLGRRRWSPSRRWTWKFSRKPRRDPGRPRTATANDPEVRCRWGPQNVSECRGCRVVDQPRSTQRYPSQRLDDETR